MSTSGGRLAGKVAIVTGGASGIGLATTRRFVAEGARVAIGDLDADGLAKLEEDLGDAVAGRRCDVRVESDVEALLAAAMWLLPPVVEEFDENAPLATTTSPDDVASLVTFLASDESSSISGTLQLIDRGAHTQRYPHLLRHVDAALGTAAPP